MHPPSDHRKIVMRPSALGPFIHADYYRTGVDNAALCLYVGGAIAEDDYERRLHSRPDPIAAEFERACGGRPMADLLVVSSPPWLFGSSMGPANEREAAGERFTKACVTELFQATDAQPRRIGVLGYSFGAFLATALWAGLDVAALATVGGVAMTDALGKTTPTGDVHVYCNADDRLLEHSRGFYDELVGRGVSTHLEVRLGGHSFEEYKENRTIRDAFAFVAKTLSAEG